MFETDCDCQNLKILDKKLEMGTNVTFSENQLWEPQIWELRKIDHVPLRLCILPKSIYYLRQIHTRVTKILDNEATHLKNDFLFITTIEQNILVSWFTHNNILKIYIIIQYFKGTISIYWFYLLHNHVDISTKSK